MGELVKPALVSLEKFVVGGTGADPTSVGVCVGVGTLANPTCVGVCVGVGILADPTCVGICVGVGICADPTCVGVCVGGRGNMFVFVAKVAVVSASQ